MTIPGVAPFALESGFWASFCSGSSSVTLMLVPVTGDPPRVEIQLAGKTVGLLLSTTADPTGHLAAAATSIGQPPQLLVPNPSPPGGFDGAAPSPRTRRLAWWSTCRFTTTQRSPLAHPLAASLGRSSASATSPPDSGHTLPLLQSLCLRCPRSRRASHRRLASAARTSRARWGLPFLHRLLSRTSRRVPVARRHGDWTNPGKLQPDQQPIRPRAGEPLCRPQSMRRDPGPPDTVPGAFPIPNP